MRDSLIGGQPINSLPCRRLISPTKMVRTAEAPGPPPFFAPPFRGKMVYAMQWAGNPNSIPASMENTHSLWAGGAAALFASGIYWIAIQRRVRWKSFTSHEYARRDSLSPPNLGGRIASTQGINRYLVEIAPLHQRASPGDIPSSHTGCSSTFTARLSVRIFISVTHWSPWSSLLGYWLARVWDDTEYNTAQPLQAHDRGWIYQTTMSG